MSDVKQALIEAGFARQPGAYVLVDGQFGSTGKGLMASVLAEHFHDEFVAVTSNAGPNSGHTCYFGDEQIVLKQLPTFGVVARKHNTNLPIYLNAGAVIDRQTLWQEDERYLGCIGELHVHPAAAVITDEALTEDGTLTGRIGSTGKGTGAAIAAKIMRKEGVTWDAIGAWSGREMPRELLSQGPVMVEVSQGFSLGINRGFYPYTTSRNCDVPAALSDAMIHPEDYRSSIMVVRTFPIRVGGNSGPGYGDQDEITWEELGQTPELTTVTKKVRRVFTWSNQQFHEALVANRPKVILVNFLNYLPEENREAFLRSIVVEYVRAMGHYPRLILGGYGPRNEDVRVAWTWTDGYV